MRRGLFISLEGGEGAGKSTQNRNIIDWLTSRGKTVVETREPGGTFVSEQIRKVLLDTRNAGLNATAELLLMFAARSQLVEEVILPSLEAGKVVICDRFADASYAYQGGGRQLGAHTVAAVEQLVLKDLQPDITLLFDIPVEQGMQRVAGRGAADRFEVESLQFFERVRSAYLERAAAFPERFRIIDASKDEAQVWQQVKDTLQAGLGL
ncbi:MAG: dTMP kinase [Gammaproteobacteria bacterium]|nr:dTMP kinase [Gammaproteobacteria bacterium]NNL00520.1 dTMP kinase [Xanthomonadales bacterium]